MSKRVNSRQRNRIQKKASEHHRKSRKLAKKNPQWKSRKPKDLGVPNSFPFKEQVLAEKEEVRRVRDEERRRKKLSVAGNGKEAKKDENGVSADGEGYVEGLQIDSEDEMIEGKEEESEDEDEDMEDEAVDEWDDEDDEDDEDDVSITPSESEWEGIQSNDDNDGSVIDDIDQLTELNTFRNTKPPPHMKAMARSDILIFVLDARAPDITRARDIELWAAEEGKNCIFVLSNAGTHAKMRIRLM